jgi:hypothetical protein
VALAGDQQNAFDQVWEQLERIPAPYLGALGRADSLSSGSWQVSAGERESLISVVHRSGSSHLRPISTLRRSSLDDRLDYPDSVVRPDATQRLPLAYNEFDLGYANSVIAHIAPKKGFAFARVVGRVPRGWCV